jgi:HEAT repeat protein
MTSLPCAVKVIVDNNDAKQLAALQDLLSASKASVQEAREVVIEALGDHMCASGSGPTPQHLRALEEARAREAVARHEIARFVVMFAHDAIARACKGSPLPKNRGE